MGHPNFRPETKVNFINTNELNITSNIEVPSIGATNFEHEHFTSLYHTHLVDTPRTQFDDFVAKHDLSPNDLRDAIMTAKISLKNRFHM